jgi:hypothetical protein
VELLLFGRLCVGPALESFVVHQSVLRLLYPLEGATMNALKRLGTRVRALTVHANC